MTGASIRLDLIIPPGAPGMFRRLAVRPGRAIPLTREWHNPEALASPPGRPIARFEGRQRTARAGACRLTLIEGTLRAGRRREVVWRLTVEGPGDAVLALDLPDAAVAGESLDGAAMRLAGRAAAEAPPALPVLDPAMTASDALALALAHFGDRLRRLAPIADAGAGPEGVHQMRVTVRRTRSALKLFRRAAGDGALDPIAGALRALGQALAPARDWDVFLGGTARAVAATAGPEAARRLVAIARRRRAGAYADLHGYLCGPEFARLGVLMAVCALSQPWTYTAPAEDLATPLAQFADSALRRQWKRLAAPGGDLADLPEARLHDIRLEAKRLRYAAELFAGLHDRKRAARFIDRLTSLQEQLGHLNDGVVADTLLDALGPAGRSYAGGVARGLVAARGEGLRSAIERTWRRLRGTKRFWS